MIKKITMWFFAGVCAVLMLWGVYRYGVVSRMASYITYPVIKGYQLMVEPIRLRWEKKRTNKQLQTDVAALTQENMFLHAQLAQLRAALTYLYDTKELRSFNKRYKRESKLAQVLARSFSDQEHYFYIDRGSRDAVETDMVVMHKNNLIGKITDVYPWYSKVCLITDRKCKIAAYGAQSRAQGIYEGINVCGKASLCHVSHLAKAREGELVLSSGEGLVFPKGFALGRITSCQVDGLYKTITVTPLCDLQTLDYCTVVARG